MIKGDKVKVLYWDAGPSLHNVIGIVEDHREVGKNNLNLIDYEYLVRFGDGSGMWIPSRYLRRL